MGEDVLPRPGKFRFSGQLVGKAPLGQGFFGGSQFVGIFPEARQQALAGTAAEGDLACVEKQKHDPFLNAPGLFGGAGGEVLGDALGFGQAEVGGGTFVA